MPDLEKFRELHDKLSVIINSPYTEKDHERNHQIFAEVLQYMLESLNILEKRRA